MTRFTDHSVAYQRNTYPKLFFVHVPNIPYSLVSFWFRAGSRFERDEKAGLAHLFEHILMKSNRRFPDTAQRLNYFEERGLQYGAFTSQDPVYYFFLQETGQTNIAFKLLLESLQDFLITKKVVEAEKERVLDEQKRQNNDPSSQIWKLANKGLWPKTGLAHDVLGSEETIRKISVNDLEGFKEKFYDVSNLTILTISPKKSDKQRIEEKVENLKTKRVLNFNAENFNSPKKIIVGERERNSVLIAVSFLTEGNKKEKDFLALRLIQAYLASGWSSALIQRLCIEENITYWVNGYLRDFPDTGLIRFIYSTQKKYLRDSMSIVLEEIEKIKTSKIPKNIIERHKKMLRLRIFTELSDPREMLKYYGWNFLAYNSTPLSIGDYIEKLNTVNSTDIQTVAKKHLKKISIAAIGPITEDDLLL